MFPPLSAIADHFKAKDTTATKQACNDVIQHFFCSGKTSLLGAQSVRTFMRQSFYNEESSILIYHKLFHAWALKTLHPDNKGTAFLQGGLYHGCKDKPKDDLRDSLYLKTGDKKHPCRQIDEFRQFQLKSNTVYLDPSSTAAHLFKTKSTHDADLKRVKRLTRNIKTWKRTKGAEPYVKMPDKANETDEDNENDSEDEKDVPKAFTKKSFKEPMSRLSNALEKLRTQVLTRDEYSLLEDVLTEYNGIQKMTGHGPIFEINQEEEEAHNTDDSGSDDDDDTDLNDGSNHNTDDSGSDDDDDQDLNDGPNDDNKSKSNEQIIGNIPAGKNSTRKEVVLHDIDTYIKSLNGVGVTCSVMSGKDIRTVLDLKTTPCLRTPNQKKYFYSFKSEKMKDIKQLYENGIDDAGEALNIKNDWTTELVRFLKGLNWSNSIFGLAEGKTIEDENVLLLWNQNSQFDTLFMTENIQQGRPLPSPTQREKRSATKKHSTPTRVEEVQKKKNLAKKLSFQTC